MLARLGRWLATNHPWLLGGVSAACLTVSNIWDGADWRFWTALGIGIGALGGETYLATRAIKTARANQEEFKLAVTDQLGPVARKLSMMAREPVKNRPAMVDAAIETCVSAASGLAGEHTRSRATFYRRGTRKGCEAFLPGPTIGRGDMPRSEFIKDRSSVEGMAVWDYAERDLPRFVVDVKAEQVPGWDHARVRAYRTFITVPVRAGNTLVGLLTVNAINPGDLSKNDVETMQVLAGLIGTVIGMGNGK